MASTKTYCVGCFEHVTTKVEYRAYQTGAAAAKLPVEVCTKCGLAIRPA